MTINLSDNNPRVSYAVAEGVTQTSFTVSFEFFDNDDLNVYVDGTLKTITTHYTVSGGNGSTGTVTMSVTGATGGSTVVITRDIDLDRTTDFPSSGPFNIGSLNTELDRMIAITADLEDLASRGVKLADFDTAATLTLPLAADRVNKVLAFNSAGDTLISQELGVWKGDWAASTAYVERDLVRDSSDGSIYIVTSAHTSSGSTPLDTNTNSSKYSVIFDIGAMIAGTVTMTGDLSVQGNTTLGNAATDTVTITADVASNILPSADNTYDLGGTGAEWKDVYIDGVAYVDSIAMPTTTVTDILDEDTMSSNSATALATQQSIKAYVDSQVGSNNELSEVLGNGNTTGGNNIQLTTTDELQFRDTALKISSSADGQLDIDADTEVEITAPTVDINASTEVNISGDFTVDTNTLHVDSTNNRVGIANLSPSTALDVTGTVTATGGAFTGNVTFGDNNKAIFGTSSNLEIYGNGGYSYIDEVGANNLNIRTNGANIGIYDTANSQYMAQFTTGGGVELYHNGAQKFTTTVSGIDIGGTVLATGGAFTGDVTFGDNDKAIFGAGSDLQIYHDGTTNNSYITESASGSLFIQGENLVLEHTNGSNYLLAVPGSSGYVKLYHNGSEKLATTSTGIDVTGTVTADGLTVTSGSSADNIVQVFGGGTIYAGLGVDGTGAILTAGSSGSADADLIIKTSTSGTETQRARFNDNGDISFYEDTGTTAKFFWDASAESLGIGTTSPSNSLEISNNTAYGGLTVSGSTAPAVIFNDTTDAAFARVSGNNTGRLILEADPNNDASGTSIEFEVDGSEAMRIDSSGNVGIGTTSPSTKVHLKGDWVSNEGQLAIDANSGQQYSGLTLQNNGTAKFFLYHDNTNNLVNIYGDTSQSLAFYTNGNNERMRIDSSGNLLVGTTTGVGQYNGTGNNGMAVNSAGQAGQYVTIQNETDSNIYLTKKSGFTDNRFIQFATNGTTVGNIRAEGSGTGFTLQAAASNGYVAFHANNQSTGIFFDDVTTKRLAPYSTRDNEFDLGDSDRRWKDLYLSGGVYLGGTGSANFLDDYEEGTFTPVVYGTTSNGTGTYTHQRGSYVKIGNLVNVQIHLGWSAHTGTGDMRMSGLPFNSENYLTYGYSGPNIHYASGLTFTRTQINGYIAASTNLLVFSQFDSGVVSGIPMDSVVTELIITAAYRST